MIHKHFAFDADPQKFLQPKVQELDRSMNEVKMKFYEMCYIKLWRDQK